MPGPGPLDGSARSDGATFVHLVDRRGSSVSVLTGPGSQTLVDGPDPEPVQGRAADACRRMLGLPTAPPPPDMTAHVVDLWLARTTRAALEHPGLDWPSVARHNPAHELAPGTAVPTPAAIARHTVAFGEQLDWERYRQRCIDAGGTPFGEIDGRRGRVDGRRDVRPMAAGRVDAVGRRTSTCSRGSCPPGPPTACGPRSPSVRRPPWPPTR